MQTNLEREITKLRKENRLLREERDILKKATVFFANLKEVVAAIRTSCYDESAYEKGDRK